MHGPDQRQRRDDDVDARAVGQAGVDHRAALVDAAAERRHDAVDDAHQLLGVAEADVRLSSMPVPLDVDLVRPVDQDFGDAVVVQERLERAVAQDAGDDLLEELARARPRLSGMSSSASVSPKMRSSARRTSSALSALHRGAQLGEQPALHAVADRAPALAAVRAGAAAARRLAGDRRRLAACVGVAVAQDAKHAATSYLIQIGSYSSQGDAADLLAGCGPSASIT